MRAISKNNLFFISKAIILINQAMAKALGVPYEPSRLDDSLGMYFDIINRRV
jgi:hypothetical protein